jgi:hypothetical protein
MTTPDGTTATTATGLLDEANHLPYCDEERELLHRALAAAGEEQNPDAEYRIRLALAASYRVADDNASLLTHFSAAAGLHDTDPVRFPGTGDGTYPDLFWHYKHAVNTVLMSCLFSREQAEALLAQMTHHYQRAGVPANAVDIERREDQLVNGSLDDALATQSRILAAGGEDPFDDCPTCRIAGELDLRLAAGETAAARADVEEILGMQGVGCVMEPETSLSKVMLDALLAGDTEFASFAHRTSMACNARFQTLNTVGRHLEFLGVTGNHARGLALLQNYLHDLTLDPLDTFGQFDFLCGAWVLLTATERAGYGAVTVTGTGTDTTVAELAVRYREQARDLADRYDQRNGNDNFARRLAVAASHTELDVPLDIGTTNLVLRAEITAPAAPQTALERFTALGAAVRAGAHHDVDLLLGGQDGPGGTWVEELPDHLRRLLHARLVIHHDEAGNDDARDAAYTEYVTELFRQGRSEAEFLASVAATDFLRVPLDDVPAWLDAAEQVRDSDPLLWARLSLRAATSLAEVARNGGNNSGDSDGSEEGARAAGIFRDILDRRLDDPDILTSASGNLLLLEMFSGAVTGDAARARYDRLRADAPEYRADGLDLSYGIAATMTGADDGLPVLDRHLAHLIDLGLREASASAALHTARLLAEAGRFEEASERARLAVRQFDAAELPSRDAGLLLGEMLVFLDRDGEARDVLEPLLLPKLRRRTDGGEEFTEYEIRCVHGLGLSLRYADTGPQPAVWTLRQAVDLALTQGFDALAVMSTTALTDLLHGLQEWDEALTALRTALPAALRLDDGRDAEMRLRDRIAVTQADAGDPAAVTTLDENMGRTVDTAQRLYVQETKNRVLSTFGRLDECLAGCGEAARLAAETGGPGAAAAQLAQGASYAMEADAPERAIDMLVLAHETPGLPDDQNAHYCATVAALYDDLGKSMAARKWKRRAEKLGGD